MTKIEYPDNPYAGLPDHGPVVVWRDDERVSPILIGTDRALFWLQGYQGQSTAYALTYGGYSVRLAGPLAAETAEVLA